MKLSKIYSNKQEFTPIYFATELNVIIGKITLPKDEKKNTHNLGKTTLTRLIDFCLLSMANKDLFLIKRKDLFEGFVFFLEIELEDTSFVTTRRCVTNPQKVSLKKHTARYQNFSILENTEWDHEEIPLVKAKTLLDGILNLESFKPWSFRTGIGYSLRSQQDFKDIFSLQQSSKAPQSTWKPFLAHILGFNADLTKNFYEQYDMRKKNKDAVKKFRDEIKKIIVEQELDSSKIQGILSIKRKEFAGKQKLLESFNLADFEKSGTKELVDDINNQITLYNTERYLLKMKEKRISDSLQGDQILFDSDKAKQIFEESDILFQGQIKKDFEQLIRFNRAITEERRQYLKKEYNEVKEKLIYIETELEILDKRRVETLSFLQDSEIFEKFSYASNQLAALQKEITNLESNLKYCESISRQEKEIGLLNEEYLKTKDMLEQNINNYSNNEGGLFANIRSFFNEIIVKVIDHKAVLSVKLTSKGVLEFHADILDGSGNKTSADLGNTYRKLLCIAFDLAVLRAHAQTKHKFPRFVYHDGAFESLDDRTKKNLLATIRHYTKFGIQHIVTIIDSDRSDLEFTEQEIILQLHDKDHNGRLFKMPEW